ncbi:3,2-trans-enoyl-CoA isomerase [Madurella mycetomatis]|uniref:3,2-trans-enoyl-CoA isomerase n=1 Tax=Madurella mycetomatis TaxID=100816 RepID=A0A175VY13_9PEZI|nr:3,2-trans-enoyl-CoA isomerase [Madurella mycetomatis]KXX76448.1 3,2-trans-enoyl-CoA isomerase [Madurella mycetomatis]
MASPSVLSLEYRGRVAIITIDNDKKLNALSQQQYYDLAQKMREVAARDDVYITLIVGKGRYFSAGMDVSFSRPSSAALSEQEISPHRFWLQTFVAFNLNIAQAFYTHPKILVVGLNGPVVGLSAALVSFADFIYAVPGTFLLTPFSSLGLVAEGCASRALVQRLGVAKANEALIMSKRITSEELLAAGFVNKVFAECGKGEDEKFKALVMKEIDERLGDHLVGDSLLGIKALIRRPEKDALDAQNVAEVFAGLDRFVSRVPQGEFLKIATGKKRHKL